MRAWLTAGVIVLGVSMIVEARQVDYAGAWAKALPFHTFLNGVRAQRAQWHSRFSNAAVDAAALNRAKALPGRRRILAVAEDRCGDSAWTVPFLAKLAAAVPEKLELRVIGRADAAGIQSAHTTPDGRLATPTIVVLDEKDRLIGAWVERPAELQKWFLDNRHTVAEADADRHMDEWYANDAGRSTIRELLAVLGREAGA